MAYDLLIKNGRIVDGSGRPAFHGDVGVVNGKIAELGKLGGGARRTIEADGRVIAPGFVDNHCHYDAQVLWDPLCTFSCHHGATTVIIGNCSLALAPVNADEREKLAGMLSYVEAIPMDPRSRPGPGDYRKCDWCGKQWEGAYDGIEPHWRRRRLTPGRNRMPLR